MLPSLRTLVIAARYPHRASYYDDWADAFDEVDCFRATQINILGLKSAVLARELERHDLVVLLHSCTADTVHWLRSLGPVLAERKHARLIAFVGNEYNSPHARIADKLQVLAACRPDVIATQLLEEAGRYLYGETCAKVVSMPHALNPDIFTAGPEHRKRAADIGVRNFRYSPLIGDADRNRIVDYFARHGAARGLATDIKLDHRVGRMDWSEFLRACRGTVSSEAGSWYLDRDDALVMRINAELNSRFSGIVLGEGSRLRQIARRLPLRVKDAIGWLLRHGPIRYAPFEEADVDFGEIHERFFQAAPRCPVHSKAISSRHLEAVGTRTCQILMRGRYNDILVAGEHYIPVAADLSDVEDAIDRFKDADERARIVASAYEHVMSSHTYAHRMAGLHEIAHAL
jgi:hypothetical protein